MVRWYSIIKFNIVLNNHFPGFIKVHYSNHTEIEVDGTVDVGFHQHACCNLGFILSHVIRGGERIVAPIIRPCRVQGTLELRLLHNQCRGFILESAASVLQASSCHCLSNPDGLRPLRGKPASSCLSIYSRAATQGTLQMIGSAESG